MLLACRVDSVALLMQTNKTCLVHGRSSTAVHQGVVTSNPETRKTSPLKHLESIKVFSDHRFRSADVNVLVPKGRQHHFNLPNLAEFSQFKVNKTQK